MKNYVKTLIVFWNLLSCNRCKSICSQILVTELIYQVSETRVKKKKTPDLGFFLKRKA